MPGPVGGGGWSRELLGLQGAGKAGLAESLPHPGSIWAPTGQLTRGDQSSFWTRGQSPGRLQRRMGRGTKCLPSEPQFSCLNKGHSPHLRPAPRSGGWGHPPGEGLWSRGLLPASCRGSHGPAEGSGRFKGGLPPKPSLGAQDLRPPGTAAPTHFLTPPSMYSLR